MYKDFWDSDETHYFKKRPLEPELLWKPSKELNFCNVRFFPNDKEYVYYCHDESIEKFDWVEVPVDENGNEIKEESKSTPRTVPSVPPKSPALPPDQNAPKPTE